MISKPHGQRDTVLIRLPRHIKDGLRSIAAENERSVTGEVTYVVARHVRERLNPITKGNS